MNLPMQAFLTQYLKLRSVSLAADNEIDETAAFLKEQFTKLGATTSRILTTDAANPAVYAVFPAQSADAPTLLFYNHYDVQPAEPLDLWKSDPFKLKMTDTHLYARGINDDKGELAARLAAIQRLQAQGGLPCTIKFLVEGGEEQGSPHLEDLLKQYADLLAADFCLWESGGRNEQGKFQISLGVKGGVAFQLSVKTADFDLHSSLGAITENPAWRLVQALATLKNANDEITIPHFLDSVKPLTTTQKQLIDSAVFDYAAFAKNYGITRPATVPADEIKEALYNRPSMTINGFSSGYEGPGIGKTILPHTALAKIDLRLVPDQTPAETVRLIKAALTAGGYDDVTVSDFLGEPPFRTDPDDPRVQEAVALARKTYGDDDVQVELNSPGSGPMKYFYDINHAPIISCGIGNANSAAHGPNENVAIADYLSFIDYLTQLVGELAA
ncbi:M20 family metallopeptidase [Lacticaseibacillus zeae]|uniref:M20/M25/M40 family metallo-hydrolase n=1 Tax=Lacticaseibacillus zeae subsp. silagei TaxID=3068307 RepID=A0ABD7Z945_LACZE|nr:MULTISPECIES: M20/M25/M40 family metallo-hydrolase [Lacticaseibacillus]MDE3316703.1 M20/M25/M40 family metallo-hydrolase [Lacticaseibacillus zeae]OFR97331.1 acetylornithine deacetylase [Lactobacillus sp. HMSC068F07]WLV83494.1 M20/M25/M40 family metallo-hydrolase [Lacticaseibacillus sp. NCIMB 15475]WLV86243.1 M20/M25/M40 family metallo-hydrolase [Lacticaseibacillus sp. NCIMB 15474]